jgi:hypothetical protein
MEQGHGAHLADLLSSQEVYSCEVIVLFRLYLVRVVEVAGVMLAGLKCLALWPLLQQTNDTMQDRVFGAASLASYQLAVRCKEYELIVPHIFGYISEQLDLLLAVLDDLEVILAKGSGPVSVPLLMLLLGERRPTRSIPDKYFL